MRSCGEVDDNDEIDELESWKDEGESNRRVFLLVGHLVPSHV